MRKIALLLALSAAACSTGVDRRAYLNTLVGAPEAEVVRQLGVPSRSFSSGGHTYLAYTEARDTYYGGGPFLFGGFGGGYYGPGFGYTAFAPTVVQRVCETTFDVVDGRVVTWSLRGNACG